MNTKGMSRKGAKGGIYGRSQKRFRKLFCEKQSCRHLPYRMHPGHIFEQLHRLGYTVERLEHRSDRSEGRGKRRNGNIPDGRRDGNQRKSRLGHLVQAQGRHGGQSPARGGAHPRLFEQPRNAAAKRHRAGAPRLCRSDRGQRRSRQLREHGRDERGDGDERTLRFGQIPL